MYKPTIPRNTKYNYFVNMLCYLLLCKNVMFTFIIFYMSMLFIHLKKNDFSVEKSKMTSLLRAQKKNYTHSEMETTYNLSSEKQFKVFKKDTSKEFEAK